MDHSEIEQVIENCEFFKGLDKGDIKKIAAFCSIKTYERGEYIFRQGDFEENLFVIAEGHVFLERSIDMGTRKGTALIATLGKGRGLGCWSSLLGEHHNLMSSASCQKPTRIVIIKGPDLRDMMVNNAELGFKVLERLCFLLRDRIQGAYGAMEKI